MLHNRSMSISCVRTIWCVRLCVCLYGLECCSEIFVFSLVVVVYVSKFQLLPDPNARPVSVCMLLAEYEPDVLLTPRPNKVDRWMCLPALPNLKTNGIFVDQSCPVYSMPVSKKTMRRLCRTKVSENRKRKKVNEKKIQNKGGDIYTRYLR